MFNTPIVAGIALYVLYAVSITKGLFDGIGQPGKDKYGNPTLGNPALQTTIVRLWAVALGVAGAVVDGHFGSNLTWGAPIYEAVKNGAIGGVFAIITYHVGTGDFIGAFNSPAKLASIAHSDQIDDLHSDIVDGHGDITALLQDIARNTAPGVKADFGATSIRLPATEQVPFISANRPLTSTVVTKLPDNAVISYTSDTKPAIPDLSTATAIDPGPRPAPPMVG